MSLSSRDEETRARLNQDRGRGGAELTGQENWARRTSLFLTQLACPCFPRPFPIDSAWRIVYLKKNINTKSVTDSEQDCKVS